MTISWYFKGTSLLKKSFFEELQKAGVLKISYVDKNGMKPMAEYTPIESVLFFDMFRANDPGTELGRILWALEQMGRACDMCKEGLVVFDFNNQEHIRLFNKLVHGMKDFLGDKNKAVRDELIEMFRTMLVCIRRDCIVPSDGTEVRSLVQGF